MSILSKLNTNAKNDDNGNTTSKTSTPSGVGVHCARNVSKAGKPRLDVHLTVNGSRVSSISVWGTERENLGKLLEELVAELSVTELAQLGTGEFRQITK